jgi:hypothetical protein
MSYIVGHVKHNPAEKLIAIRTIFPEDVVIGNQAWNIASTNRGGAFLSTADVEGEGWSDLFIPEPAPEGEG